MTDKKLNDKVTGDSSDKDKNQEKFEQDLDATEQNTSEELDTQKDDKINDTEKSDDSKLENEEEIDNLEDKTDLDDSKTSTYREKTLAIDDISEMTIEEIQAEANKQEAENLKNESVLDAYIREHRQQLREDKNRQIAEMKANQSDESENQNLSLNPDKDEESSDNKLRVVNGTSDNQNDTSKPNEKSNKNLFDNSLKFYDKHKVVITWLLLVIAIIALIAGGSYASHQANKKAIEREAQAEKAAKQKEEQKKESAFEAELNKFYTSDTRTALKNDYLSHYSEMKDKLTTVKKSSNYKEYQGQVDALKKQIDSLNAINSKFDKPVIVDGKIVDSAQPKEGVDFVIPKSGLPELDKTIDTAIAKGKNDQKAQAKAKEEAAKKAAESQAAAKKAAEESAAKEKGESQASTSQNAAATTNQTQQVAEAAPTTNQSLGGDALSRVPINQAEINDSTNPAWLWAPGIMDRVLNTCRERGYISGNDYILKPVNIINGNGYYNLYKTDGTYLVSINCKTGYFVGNASGNADSLDY
jgi:AAA ATPase containing von Willebrand factor type A (vWA) domain